MGDSNSFGADFYRRHYDNPRTAVTSRREMARRGGFIASFVTYLDLPIRSVLDAGCGMGWLRAPLERGIPDARYVGLETSDYLCRRFGWQHGSIASHRPRTPYDLVICYDVLQCDEIVTTQHEHAAGVYPWLLQAKRRGVRLVQISLPSPLPHPQHAIDAFAAALTPRTRVIAFSHVQYTDGSLLPVRELSELARARNALSVVDGAQAPGMLPVTLRELGCDFYAANFHKWVNGPAGTGVLYLRDAARHRVWPSAVAGHDEWDALDRDGIASAQPAADYRAEWPGAMRKYDHDFQHFAPLFLSLLPAIQFQRDIGQERVAARIRELAWYLRLQLQRVTGLRILTSAHPQLWAGIVSFQVPGVDSAELARRLLAEHRIAVQAVKHAAMGFDAVRASTHIYNSHDDIDRLVNAVARLVR